MGSMIRIARLVDGLVDIHSLNVSQSPSPSCAILTHLRQSQPKPTSTLPYLRISPRRYHLAIGPILRFREICAVSTVRLTPTFLPHLLIATLHDLLALLNLAPAKRAAQQRGIYSKRRTAKTATAVVIRITNRRITAHILRHARRLSDCVVHIVTEDTGGLRFFRILAGAAGEHEFCGLFVFFGVEHIGAVGVQ